MKRINNTEGQLSFWDIEVPMNSSKVNKIAKEVIKVENMVTEEQEKVMNKYKSLNELSRVIKYAGGGLGIELKNESDFKTIYVNKVGEEEFVTPTQATVQPIDKIVLFKNDYEINEIQRGKLADLKQRYNLKHYIKRNGDRNVIVKTNEKVISINPKGWILEYSEAIHETNEVLEFENVKVEYKVGDLVEAKYGKELIVGSIYSRYENQDSVNIVWDNKHSAFHISSIIRKIA